MATRTSGGTELDVGRGARLLGEERLFWSSVMLASQRFFGNPMRKHQPLPIDAAHFDRWLELFRVIAGEVCPPGAAAHFIERAEHMVRNLEQGVAGAHGVKLGLNERCEQAP